MNLFAIIIAIIIIITNVIETYLILYEINIKAIQINLFVMKDRLD